MKRHEVLAALAAAAGLTFAVPAQAGIASSAGVSGKPMIETLAELQQQVGDSDDALREVIAAGRPYLGICLGLQILFDTGEEHGPVAGLGLVPGRVVRLGSRGDDGRPCKVPHIGWNAVHATRPDPLLVGLGGFVGSAGRFLVGGLAHRLAPGGRRWRRFSTATCRFSRRARSPPRNTAQAKVKVARSMDQSRGCPRKRPTPPAKTMRVEARRKALARNSSTR